MAKKKLEYKQKLSALFVSFTIVIMGTISLARSMSLDYYTVLSTISKLLPSCLATGFLGWIMGSILDQPRRRPKMGYTNLFVNELMKNDLAENSIAEDEMTMAESA